MGFSESEVFAKIGVLVMSYDQLKAENDQLRVALQAAAAQLNEAESRDDTEDDEVEEDEDE